MVCPFCLHKKTKVYNSRSTSLNMIVWRRRQCLTCKKTFTTKEELNPGDHWKIYKNKRESSYSRSRLITSLLRACDHLTAKEDKVFYLLNAIEQKLLPFAAKNNLVLQASEITTATANILKNYDPTAYVKYISYHQPHMDLKSLRQKLKKTNL